MAAPFIWSTWIWLSLHSGVLHGSSCCLTEADAAAVAAAEEEQEGEDSRDEDAASTAALDYMESPSLLNSNAGRTASHGSMQGHAGPDLDVEQREAPEPVQQRPSPDLQQASAADLQDDAPVSAAHEDSGRL